MNWRDNNEERPEFDGVYLCKCVDEIYCIYDDHRGYEDTEPYYSVLEFLNGEWQFDSFGVKQRVVAWADFPECTIGD